MQKKLAQKKSLPYRRSFQLGFTFLRRNSLQKANPLLKLILWKTKFSGGFTLIEIIIAITIVTIMATIGIASFNSVSTNNEVSQKTQEIKSTARRLRTDALASRKPVDCPATSSYFGTYVRFSFPPLFYRTRSLCFSNTLPNNNVAPAELPIRFSTNTNILTQAWGSDGDPIGSAITIVFANNGEVVFLNTVPNFSNMTDPAGPGRILANRVWVDIGNGSNTRRINFNKAGLVCEEPTTVTTSCAE